MPTTAMTTAANSGPYMPITHHPFTMAGLYAVQSNSQCSPPGDRSGTLALRPAPGASGVYQRTAEPRLGEGGQEVCQTVPEGHTPTPNLGRPSCPGIRDLAFSDALWLVACCRPVYYPFACALLGPCRAVRGGPRDPTHAAGRRLETDNGSVCDGVGWLYEARLRGRVHRGLFAAPHATPGILHDSVKMLRAGLAHVNTGTLTS